MVRALNEKYISFFTDFGFKRLFGSEQSKNILMDFLNEMFKDSPEMPEGVTPRSPIISLEYMKNEQMGRKEDDRRSNFDVQCKNDKGEIFVIELQKSKQEFFKDRSLFYASFPIIEQAQKGDWNFELKPVYVVGIMDFCFNKEESDQYRHDVRLTEIPSGKLFHEKLAFTYFEMPRFKKNQNELVTKFDNWLYAIKNLALLERIPPNMKNDEVFEDFFERAAVAKMSNAEYNAYQDSLKNLRDYANVMNTAVKEAKEKGEAIGEQRGELKGKLEAAAQMLLDGVSIENISKWTNLPPEEIHVLKNRRNQ